jgi:hypothetical protein
MANSDPQQPRQGRSGCRDRLQRINHLVDTQLDSRLPVHKYRDLKNDSDVYRLPTLQVDSEFGEQNLDVR